ncbi:peptide ABC transporter substrate-binding protein [Tengunoibacter tsumagoiensis]|uniref:Dipeptide-binding protein DppE n=1 Tax=Tengunoibacter tsumagoiensis TaxID=2014871 RepID=A0A402A3Z7_9CHLR|nr:peptide ABC transporter substrate-binding protein [Tengunoibacter tsumagoiensis]GCE13731.1 dipeptide-binding protein DppE [Tengunoibacter tsumagoiensis]
MKPGKRLTVPILSSFLCALALILSACGSTTSTPTSVTKADDSKQIFRYPVVGDVATLDPALVEDTDSNFPIQSIYTGLVTLDSKLQVKPQLAESYNVSSDQMTYTFKLRSGLKFSDGSPLTAKDVIYSINRTVLPATKSDVSYYLQLLKDFDKVNAGTLPTLIDDSLSAPDDNTVVIKISQPAAYFLQALSYPTSYVVNQKLVERYGPQWTDHLDEGAGSGPFKVASYSHSKGIELVANDTYYGKKPGLKKLSIPFFTDQAAMYRAYQSKQLDYTPVPPENLETERSNKQFRELSQLSISYLAMNYLAKPFDNIKIRQAFALALNKDIIVKTAVRGAYTATNHMIPQGMPGYDLELKGPDGTTSTKGNPDKAKTLLAEGLKEEGLSSLPPITLTYYAKNPGFKKAIDQAQQQWQDNLGVTVTVNSVARAELLKLESATKNNAGPLQMWQANWTADYPDPQDWLSTFYQKGTDYNQFNYGQNNSTAATEQQAVQDELVKADVESDNAARLKLYNDAEQKTINDVGWLPLWQLKAQSLTQSNVHGFNLNSQQQLPPDDWSDVYITQ